MLWISQRNKETAVTMDCTGGRREQRKGSTRGRSASSSSQKSLNQKKDQAVLGFPCKKPVRLRHTLKPSSSAKPSKKQIDGRSEKATAELHRCCWVLPRPRKNAVKTLLQELKTGELLCLSRRSLIKPYNNYRAQMIPELIPTKISAKSPFLPRPKLRRLQISVFQTSKHLSVTVFLQSDFLGV
jgi:hypothetical protein